MTTLDKHLYRSLLVPLAYCLIGFSMLIIVWNLLDHLSKFMQAQTGIIDIIIYYTCYILTILDYLAPASLLLSTLYALWQLTRSNELIAMRACGLGLHRIMQPYLFIGLLFTILSFVIKETIAVKAFEWTKKFEKHKYQNKRDESNLIVLNYYNSNANRMWHIEQFNPDKPEDIRIVKVSEERPDGTRIRDLISSRAEWLDGSWWFHNLYIQKYHKVQDLPEHNPEPALPGNLNIKELTHLTEEPILFASEVRPWQFLTTWEMLKYLKNKPHISDDAYRRKWLSINNRMASPFLCFIVILLGIPAGTSTGRQNGLTGIFSALVFFFGIYALNYLGLMLGKAGIVYPWLGAWLANIVFLACGLVMIYRMR